MVYARNQGLRKDIYQNFFFATVADTLRPLRLNRTRIQQYPRGCAAGAISGGNYKKALKETALNRQWSMCDVQWMMSVFCLEPQI